MKEKDPETYKSNTTATFWEACTRVAKERYLYSDDYPDYEGPEVVPLEATIAMVCFMLGCPL